MRPATTPLDELTHPIVALNGLSDPENVGGIVRTCRAFGVRSLLVDKQSCDPYLRRAVRVSMGAIFDMNVCIVEKLDTALGKLSNRFSLVAVETGSSIHSLIVLRLFGGYRSRFWTGTSRPFPRSIENVPNRCSHSNGSVDGGVT